ncbi:MAG: peptidoglycan-associated lipoprotein Pal [Desulfobacterales bacterium]
MKKRVGMLCILLLMVALMMTLGCSKKQIKADESAIGKIDSYDVGEEGAREGVLSEEEEAARRSAAEEQYLMDEKKRQEMIRQQQFVAEDIYFDFDQAVIRPDAQEILRKKAEYMHENPRVSVVIEGHCDDRGTAEYNLALGERRALAAKAFLMNMGISGSRLMTISYGEERPVDPGNNEEAWAKNRRAHFVLR